MIVRSATTVAPTQTIVYPETDGMPLPDGEVQAPQYIKAVGTLRVHFEDIPGARVNGNTMLYYIRGNPRVFLSPDCYVVLRLSDEAWDSIERNNVYLLWEVGKAPDFVLEIASKSTADVDLGRKRDLYAELGVREYWRYDPTGSQFYREPLVGERLVDGEYRRLEIRVESDGRVWSHSEVLDLDLWWVEGDLRFYDPAAGSWLLSHEEEKSARESAEASANIERSRAETAEARVMELEAELRRLRGE